jgi:hypothetical protein
MVNQFFVIHHDEEGKLTFDAHGGHSCKGKTLLPFTQPAKTGISSGIVALEVDKSDGGKAGMPRSSKRGINDNSQPPDQLTRDKMLGPDNEAGMLFLLDPVDARTRYIERAAVIGPREAVSTSVITAC